jgi:hypothetical protein
VPPSRSELPPPFDTVHRQSVDIVRQPEFCSHRGRLARDLICESLTMVELTKLTVNRRNLLLGVAALGAAAATGGASIEAEAAQTDATRGKRRSRYQPNSAEVQTYYRVNGYPKK